MDNRTDKPGRGPENIENLPRVDGSHGLHRAQGAETGAGEKKPAEQAKPKQVKPKQAKPKQAKPKQAKQKQDKPKQAKPKQGKRSQRADGNTAKKRGAANAKASQNGEEQDKLDTSHIAVARGISHEERRRKQNRRDMLRLGAVVLAIVLVAAALFWAYKFTTVKTIHVSGSKVYGEAQLLSMSGIRPGKNIFFYSESSIRDDMNAIHDIRTVSVSKQLPSTINIVVDDIDPAAAILSADGRYAFVSVDGYVLSIGESDPKGLIEIRGMTGVGFALNTFIDKQNATIRTVGAVRLLKAIAESALDGKVLAIDLSSSAYVTMDVENDYTFVLGSLSTAEDCIGTAAMAYAKFLPVYPMGGTVQVFPESTVVDFTPNK